VLALDFSVKKGSPLRVLCLGAHSDDIEIGCGGLILSLVKSGRPLHVTWVVFSAPGAREREARRGAALFLKGIARPQILIHQFRDGHFPYEGAAVKSVCEGLKKTPPDIVLTRCGSCSEFYAQEFQYVREGPTRWSERL